MTLTLFADASAASAAMQSYVAPTVAALCGIAGLLCTFFLINGGIQYITSTGNPDKIEHAKKIIKNAFIGLLLVIGAVTLTAILSHAYTSSDATASTQLPALQAIEPTKDDTNLWDVLINAVVGLLRNIVQSIGEPFLKALSYFINSTPLMAENPNVFKLWLAIVGITDVLFILAVTLLGLQIMSSSTLGFDEIDIKQLLPRLALAFLFINTSIFAIDAVIELSNAMIRAMQSALVCTDVWETLVNITKKSSDLGVAGLLIMIAFLILVVMLLVYYVLRLVALYVGAILSPLVILLWLLPAFKDFSETAQKAYTVNIFVVFIHSVIMLLASSIFTGMLTNDTNGQPNTLMALIVGIATVITLLKTQGFMQELSYAASAPKAAHELSKSFIRSASHMKRQTQSAHKSIKRGLNKIGGGNNEPNYEKRAKSVKPLVVTIRKDEGTPNAVTASPRPKTPEASPLKTGETRKVIQMKDKE